MVSMPGLCGCCSWKSSTTSGSMDLGRRRQSYPSYAPASRQPSGSLRTETKSESCCPGLGLTYRGPGNVRACIPPTLPLPTLPDIWCSFRTAPRTELLAPICKRESCSPAQARQKGPGTAG